MIAIPLRITDDSNKRSMLLTTREISVVFITIAYKINRQQLQTSCMKFLIVLSASVQYMFTCYQEILCLIRGSCLDKQKQKLTPVKQCKI